ncbi:glucosamine 6-phosphate N-acetyltransferase [Rhizophagus irregularis DAOM 181602=DAOM 197198]|nr:glucosamine 6-phosphate N-acetyltransferase [Rhizophagus irregularis DAOM 181602=DAOM 197198]
MSVPENLLFTSTLISPEVQAALPKVIGNISKARFLERFFYLKAHNHEYFTLVIVSPENRIVGAGTIFIERKFIRNTGLVGHIEDIAVDKNQQGKKLGLRVIQALKYIGAKTGCYKVILDCSEKNVPFYEKCGFQKKEVEMAWYCDDNSTKAKL